MCLPEYIYYIIIYYILYYIYHTQGVARVCLPSLPGGVKLPVQVHLPSGWMGGQTVCKTQTGTPVWTVAQFCQVSVKIDDLYY